MKGLDNIERTALIIVFIAVGSVILRTASESQWKQFTSREGAFSVLMPRGEPKAETQTITVNGINMELHIFSGWNRRDSQFSVSYLDSPILPTAEAGERGLDSQRQALIENDEKRMLSAEKLTVNGFPVRRYKAIAKDGSYADEMIYLVRRRLYTLLVVHDKGRDEDDVKKFFGSFTFEPKE